MAYLPELHRCCSCGVDLGPENGDGICLECEAKVCDGCGHFREQCQCGDLPDQDVDGPAS